MSRYRKVDPKMWGDAKFRALTPPPPCGQSLFQYLLTCREHTNVPGILNGGKAHFAEALGWPLEGFQKAFGEVLREGLAKADWGAQMVWLPNSKKYNVPESPNVVLSWRTAWDEVPECALKLEAYHALKAFTEGLGKAFGEAFAKACAKPSPKALANQEQEQEQEQDKSNVHQQEGLPLDVPPVRPVAPRDRASEVLEYWQAKLAPRAKITPARIRVVAARLKEGFDVDQLRSVVDGVLLTPWNMGENPNGMKYTDVGNIFGSADKVERHIATAEAAGGARTLEPEPSIEFDESEDDPDPPGDPIPVSTEQINALIASTRGVVNA